MIPAATYLDDTHIYIWADLESTQITFDHFKEQKDGTLYAEVNVTTNLPNGGHLLGPSKLNLLADRSIGSVASGLTRRLDMVDWHNLLIYAAKASVEYWRNGDPLELVDTDADIQRRWLLPPFLEDSGYTVLFARGGSGKSFLAAAMAVAQATGQPIFGETPVRPGPVVYLDWESSKPEFDSRITRLCRPLRITDPPIYYRQQFASLNSTAHSLGARFAKLGVSLCIIDSKGMAITGGAEGSEPVLELNRALRRLRVPVLLIDHVSKGQIKGDDPDMAYGSVYVEYQARLAWSAKAEGRPQAIQMYLKNTKANNGPIQHPLGVTFHFTDKDIETTCDHQAVPITRKGTAADLAAEALASGSLDLSGLVGRTGMSKDALRKALSRDPTRFMSIGGTDLWKLTETTIPF